MSFPASDGAEPWIGSYSAGWSFAAAAHRGNQTDRSCERRRFVAQNVSKQIAGEDHVKLRGPQQDLHRGIVHIKMIERDAGIFAREGVTVWRQSVEVASTLALSTLVRWRLRAAARSNA